jgi:hypothetical protein
MHVAPDRKLKRRMKQTTHPTAEKPLMSASTMDRSRGRVFMQEKRRKKERRKEGKKEKPQEKEDGNYLMVCMINIAKQVGTYSVRRLQ